MIRRPLYKTGILSLFFLLLSIILLFSVSCVPGNEAYFIDELLKNSDELGGEFTIVTNDGETVTITITKGTQAAETNIININEKDRESKLLPDQVTNNSTANTDLTSVLPSLDSIEDVFKTLGVWEDASRLREKGLTWSHIARELGYGSDNMHIRLQDIIEEKLKLALREGLINQEQLETKFRYFNELAIKWVTKIFSE